MRDAKSADIQMSFSFSRFVGLYRVKDKVCCKGKGKECVGQQIS